ncbi:hypothetical protein H312_01922 [Anncaliia algerae PRA339]|uniref:ISXO2-like transposase domain-containing protein n=1 Tax=Anncaliia algerae PRA339 TaxID=1288291 RepID=A0A059F124_9MICR|nr:hypothetical protein H312_01922 [Anncaliia algerae PRA339]
MIFDKEYDEFLKKFRHFLMNSRYGLCNACNSTTRFVSVDSWTEICTWNVCKRKESILSNTIISYRKKTLKFYFTVFKLMFQSIKLKDICTLLNCSYKSIKSISRKINNNVKEKYYDLIKPIGGPNLIVEIDESKFGKRKYNKGHRVEGVWVLGLVERSEKRKIIYIPLADRKKETLIKIIRRFVLPGSTIYTDCWKGYLGLNEYFNHLTVNHSVSFVDENTGVHTNTIEGNWSLMKRNVPIR